MFCLVPFAAWKRTRRSGSKLDTIALERCSRCLNVQLWDVKNCSQALEQSVHNELNSNARKRLLSRPGEPLLFADWEQLLMIHYRVDPDSLQDLVPFKLDRYDQSAWISLVAFTLRDMRPRWFGPLGARLFKPIATQNFLNLRTYVKVRGENGIFFLAEWLTNRVSVILGPIVFGLPYRYGRIRYRHHTFKTTGHISGRIYSSATDAALSYTAHLSSPADFCESGRGSLTEWLMERYTAFTHYHARARFFRVWHEPYLQSPAAAQIHDQSLIEMEWPLLCGLKPQCANFCPGVRAVWMGRPHSLRALIS